MENIGTKLRGMYRDVLYDSVNQLVFDRGWVSNTIVDDGRVLLASFMKGEQGTGGISWLKVGRGLASWGSNPEHPPVTATDLQGPYSEKISINPKQDMFFLDERNNQTPQPTSRLEIRVVLGQNFPQKDRTCELREFGLFSKDMRMINCVYHPLIQKSASDTLIRVIRLFF
jgi:hypothetical protein